MPFNQTVVIPATGRDIFQPVPTETDSGAESSPTDMGFVNADSGEFDVVDVLIDTQGDGIIIVTGDDFAGSEPPLMWPGRINGVVLDADEVIYTYEFTPEAGTAGTIPQLYRHGKCFALYTLDFTYAAGTGTITATVNGFQLNTITITINNDF